MNRIGTVDEVAAVVSFLMSDDASYVTRQVIGVSGGHHLMKRVVITGLGGVTALGNDWEAIEARPAQRP